MAFTGNDVPAAISPEEIESWRRDTEGCQHRVHLNNAGASLMPRPVAAAIHDHIALEERTGGYEAANLRAPEVATAYADISNLVNAGPRNIAIVGSATAGFVQSMSSFDLKRGDAILTTRSDYTSYQIHFLALRDRLGVEIIHADDFREGGADPESIRSILKSRKVRLVHVSWIPTHSGLVQDVESIGDVCAQEGVPYLVDACQAVGQIPIDVTRLKCDYLSVTARKFLRGPRGIGFLYASDTALERGDYPLFVDMRGAQWTSVDSFVVDPTARRYEDWEFSYGLVLGLGAAARYATGLGIERTGKRAIALAERLREGLADIGGARVLDTGTSRSAIVTFSHATATAERLVEELSRRNINSSLSLRWYGMIDFTSRGVESAVRLSPHYYNTEEEIDSCLEVIKAAIS